MLKLVILSISKAPTVKRMDKRNPKAK